MNQIEAPMHLCFFLQFWSMVSQWVCFCPLETCVGEFPFPASLSSSFPATNRYFESDDVLSSKVGFICTLALGRLNSTCIGISHVLFANCFVVFTVNKLSSLYCVFF